jgi:hypothetical protein
VASLVRRASAVGFEGIGYKKKKTFIRLRLFGCAARRTLAGGVLRMRRTASALTHRLLDAMDSEQKTEVIPLFQLAFKLVPHL